MKKLIVIIAAMALTYNVRAQSLDDGIKMYNYERYQSAEKILAPLAAGNPVANYYAGLSELGQDNIDNARATFSKFPDDAANMSGMARIAFMQGRAAEGTQIAQTVASKAKKKDWQIYKYAADAITYTEGGNIQQAIDWYKKALESADNAELHIALGDAYQKVQGGGGEAMNNYEKVTGKDAKNSLAFSRIGALWYAAKNYSLALENYEKAKNADPTNPIPYRDLANAYYWVNKFELAKQNDEKYLELSDKTADDERQYMDILYLSKDYQGAIKKSQELIQSGTRKPSIYGILGSSQLETGDSVNALNNFRMFITGQDPKKIYPADYLTYARIMLKNKMTDSADFYFNKAIQVDTSANKSEIYRQIAEGFKANKEYVKSAQWYKRLITAYPQTQAIDYFWWGAMDYYSKNYKEAATAFEQMETKYPDQPSATYWRGRVAAATDEEGKEGTATPYYKKWLDAVGPNYDKKADLMQAYQYLALYYYNKGDKVNMQIYLDKILAIEPGNSFVKQIKDAESKSGAKAPAKGGKK